MSKISTYDVAPVPKLADKLIGTSVGGTPDDGTYNFTLQELLTLFLPNIPANNLQGVLNYGNTATQDINLTGTIYTTDLDVSSIATILDSFLTGDTHITGGLFDVNTSIGTAGQVLTSTGFNVEWYTIPTVIPDLQQVLTAGNTSTLDIILTSNLSALDVSSDTATFSTDLTIDGTLTDGTASVGTAGKVLSSTGTGVQWVSLPVYSATSPLFFDSNTGVFSIQVANGTQDGYLTSADWITFNGKQNAGNYITALTGEATATGPGSVAITLSNTAVIGKILTGLSITGAAITSTDTILQAFGKAQNQINGKQDTITLTTTGTSGASTLIGATLNIPQYTDAFVGTVTSVAASGGTGISISGSPITTSGTLTITNTAPDQVVALTASTGISVSGTYPNFTITNTSPSSGGTVTSVAALTLGTVGTDLSSTVANSTTTPVITLNVPTASAANRGALSAADWTTFDNKQIAGNYITSLTGEATALGPGAAAITLTNSAVIAKVLTGLNVTGGTVIAADTILAAFGKVQNQINGLIGGSVFQGVWNASTNTPALVSSVGTNGHYYIVSVAGSTNLDGITDWQVGDWAIFAGTSWQKVDNTDAVSSVNGFTGAVSLTTDNIAEGATNLYFTNTRARTAISLTTTGSSGASTYDNTTGVFNIPTYTDAFVGTVTSVGLSSATSGVTIGSTPVTTSGTITIAIATATASQNGLLSSTDWTTFNSKQGTITLTTTGTSGAATFSANTLNIPQYQASGTYVTSVTGTSPIVSSGGTTPAISIPVATTLVNGYLSSTDWTTFNGKQATITLTTTGTSGAATFSSNTLNIPNYADGGVLSLSAIGAVPNANAATITGTVLNLQPADASFGGVVTTGTQTFAGAKTVSSTLASTFVGQFFENTGASTSAKLIRISNTSGDASLGIEGSTPTQIITAYGGVQYSTVLKTVGLTQLILGTNSKAAITIDSATQIVTLAAGLSGTTASFSGQLTLNSTITNGTYTYTLPSATGTLALVGGAGVGTVTSVAALTLGTTGTDLSSTVATGTTTPVITLQVPTASAANRGALSSADWSTFNGKQGTITLTTTGTSGAATFSANTLNIPNYGSALSGYLPLTGGTLTGGLTISMANYPQLILNSSNSNGATINIQEGGVTNAKIGHLTQITGLQFSGDGTNVHQTIASTGAATFSSSVTATAADAAVGLKVIGGTGRFVIYPYFDATYGVLINSYNTAESGYKPMGFQASAYYFLQGAATFSSTVTAGDSIRINKSSNSGSASTFPVLEIKNSLATQGDGSSTFNFASLYVNSGNDAVNMVVSTTYAAGTWAPAGIIAVTTNHGLQFKTNNTLALTIASTGAATFSSSVTAATESTITGTSVNSRLLVTAAGVANTVIGFNNSGATSTGVTNNTAYVGVLQTYPLVFTTDSVERLRIASTGAATFSGNLGVGTNKTSGVLNAAFEVYNNATGAASSTKTRISGGSNGANSGTMDNEYAWNDYGNVDQFNLVARIRGVATSNSGSDVSGKLEFYTKATGGTYLTSPVLALTIASTGAATFSSSGLFGGELSVGGSLSADRMFQVSGTAFTSGATQYCIVNNPTMTTPTTIYGYYGGITVTSATIAYGLYLVAAAGTITTKYGIYQEGTNDKNYFAGNVGIGTTSPTAKLQINSTSAGAATVAAFLVNGSTTINTEVRLAFAANTNDDIASGRYSYISALNTSGVNGQALIFATNETGNSAVERLRIASTGAATFSSSITTAAPSGGTAKPFKVGAVSATGPAIINKVMVEIDSVVYYIPLSAAVV